MLTIQEMIEKLDHFWQSQGCALLYPYDLEKGAGTFHPATFLYSLGKEPANVAYVEPSRRPSDGRYGQNPNRFYKFHQYQVLLKPTPTDCQGLYLESLKSLGLKLDEHDIRFVHDDWASPTLGANGLGWEVWCDGMEITQFTYFQQVGSIPCEVVSCELTYGLERLAMYLQEKQSGLEIQWNERLTWKDLFQESERQFTAYHLQDADSSFWKHHFEEYEKQAIDLCNKKLPLVAYDFVLKCSHAFNSLEALGAISTTQRADYISRIKHLSQIVAASYIENRKELGYPNYVEEPRPSLPIKEPKRLAHKEDLLIEIGVEELPASYIEPALTSWQALFEDFFGKEEIKFDAIVTYATPRRLTLLVQNVDCQTKETLLEKKGPKVAALFNPEPTKALEGFLSSVEEKASSLEEIKNNPYLKIEKVQNEEYLFVKKKIPSKNVALLIQKTLPEILRKISFPKKMRWGDGNFHFARPIQWLCILFGSEPIELLVENIKSQPTTFGHRFLAPDPIFLNHPREYLASLEKAFVIADMDKRKALLEEELKKMCKKSHRRLAKKSLLNEVVNLVEYPFILEGGFDANFLKLPKELLICEMQQHQKTFALCDEKGALTNRFLITANTKPTTQIRLGNEKVIQSRLYDGEFLFVEDQKTTLKKMREKLKEMNFQQKLGSMFDKTQRLKKHAEILYGAYPKANLNALLEAAENCKSDLVSQVVFEFPELQGTLGSYLARQEQMDLKSATAIQEHYLPTSEQGELPSSYEGILLSIADKLDSLIGLFAAGKKPTSSNDPFALRRAAIGISRMIIHYSLPFEMTDLLLKMSKVFPFKIGPDLVQEVYEFILKRFQGVLSSELEMSNLHAIKITKSGNLYDYSLRIKGLQKAMGNRDFDALKEVLKRSNNLSKNHEMSVVNPRLFEDADEKKLFTEFTSIKKEFEEQMLSGNYEKALLALAKLQEPLSHFFDHVHVMTDNNALKNNRLSLLRQIFSLSQEIFE